MDLAKVGEVRSFIATLPEGAVQNEVNAKLKEGWVLVSAKIIENPERRDIRVQPAIVVYVLGKPRENPKSVEREKQHAARKKEDEEWRREHLSTDDARHPDFQLHGKGSS